MVSEPGKAGLSRVVNRVEISFTKDENELLFSVFNTKEKIAQKNITHKGIGIANVKRRLELLYPKRHQLEIVDEEEYYQANLKLQIE